MEQAAHEDIVVGHGISRFRFGSKLALNIHLSLSPRNPMGYCILDRQSVLLLFIEQGDLPNSLKKGLLY